MTNFVIDDRVLQRLIRECPEMVDKAIRATAFDVEAQAKDNAAVDTGAMRASIFTKTSKSSGYDAAAGAAEGANPGVEVNDPTPGDPPLMTAYVAPGVNYAMYVEFGLPNNENYPQQPFMTPAIENAEEKFTQYMKEVFGEL